MRRACTIALLCFAPFGTATSTMPTTAMTTYANASATATVSSWTLTFTTATTATATSTLASTPSLSGTTTTTVSMSAGNSSSSSEEPVVIPTPAPGGEEVVLCFNVTAAQCPPHARLPFCNFIDDFLEDVLSAFAADLGVRASVNLTVSDLIDIGGGRCRRTDSCRLDSGLCGVHVQLRYHASAPATQEHLEACASDPRECGGLEGLGLAVPPDPTHAPAAPALEGGFPWWWGAIAGGLAVCLCIALGLVFAERRNAAQERAAMRGLMAKRDEEDGQLQGAVELLEDAPLHAVSPVQSPARGPTPCAPQPGHTSMQSTISMLYSQPGPLSSTADRTQTWLDMLTLREATHRGPGDWRESRLSMSPDSTRRSQSQSMRGPPGSSFWAPAAGLNRSQTIRAPHARACAVTITEV